MSTIDQKNTDNYVAFRLKSERKRLKLVLDVAGEICGVSGKTFSRWEAGTPIPSDKLVMLYENDFDIFYILAGGRITSDSHQDASLESPDKNIYKSDSYKETDAIKEKAAPRPIHKERIGRELGEKSVNDLGLDEVADLGRVFFEAWHRIYYTDGTEMQSAIMSALKGPHIAHILVSDQFRERRGEIEKTTHSSREKRGPKKRPAAKDSLGRA